MIINPRCACARVTVLGFLSVCVCIVAKRPGMARTARNFGPCPGGVPVVLEFMLTLHFSFHSFRWPLQSQAYLV